MEAKGLENQLRRNVMNQLKCIAAVSSLSLLSFAAQAAVIAPQTLPLDKPSRVDNIGLDCMGVGTHDRERSLARKYSIRLETVGGYLRLPNLRWRVRPRAQFEITY